MRFDDKSSELRSVWFWVLGMGIGLGLAMAAGGGESEPDDSALRVIEVRKIWDRAPHNAFTDLVRHNGKWLCAFREGEGHVSPDGKLRVIGSKDGDRWESVALIEHPEGELRDPKLSVTSDREVMVSGVIRYPEEAAHRHQSVAWFSKDLERWEGPVSIGDPDFWLWRVTWHDDQAYSFGYRTVEERFIRLYRSPDGRQFSQLADRVFTSGYPNETALLFKDDGTALCLLRRDGDRPTAQLGRADPPYRDWEWTDLGARIGGPVLLQLPGGEILAGGRRYEPETQTALFWLDPERDELREVIVLPSGGDTSYPGLVWYNDQLWMSFYSSHEGKASIYLAKIEVRGEP